MDMVNVPVPAHWVAEVYELLGKLAAQERLAASSNDSGDAEVSTTATDDEFWPNDLVRRAYRDAETNRRNVLEYLADHAETEIESTDLAEAVGLGIEQLRGVLGAFGHRCKVHYKKKELPFQIRWNGARCVYMMPKRVADEINAERNGS